MRHSGFETKDDLMRTRENPQDLRVRDNPPAGGDRFARESNTWRRMKPYPIWASVIAAAAFIVGGFLLLS